MHLGHRSIVTTMNVYAQEIPESVKQMVEEDEALVLTPKQEEQQERTTQKSRNHYRHSAAQRARTKGQRRRERTAMELVPKRLQV